MVETRLPSLSSQTCGAREPGRPKVWRGSSCTLSSWSSETIGRRAVEVAELDVEVVGRRLDVLGAEIGRRAGDVARVRLLDGELADRPALDLVGLEQLRSGLPCSTSASFQARLWASWIPVLPPNPPFGGIRCAASPARKIAAVLVPPCHVGGRAPAGDAVDLARRGPGSPTPARTSSISRCSLMSVAAFEPRPDPLGVADRVHDQEAGLAILVQAEEPAEHRIVDVDHAERLAQQLGARDRRVK